jgi:hypothetical protein
MGGRNKAGLERDPERLGRSAGWEDALAGQGQDYQRHLAKLHPRADEDDFVEAYLESYRAAEISLAEQRARDAARNAAPHSHGFRDDPDQAFDAGRDAGRRDRQRGLSRNAHRHAGATEGPASATKAWILGYGEGWAQ